jgi:hypothetical protein
MAYSLQDYLEGTVSRHDLQAYSRIFDNEESQQALQEFFRCEDQRYAAINKVFKAARKQREEHSKDRTSSSSMSTDLPAVADDPISASGGRYIKGGEFVRNRTASSSASTTRPKVRAADPVALSPPPPAKRVLVGFPVFKDKAIEEHVAAGTP